MLHVIRFLTLLVFFVAGTNIAHSSDSVLSLEKALTLGQQNPRLNKTQAHSEAMAEMPSQSAALPDPMIHINAMNLPDDTYKLDQEPMTQLQVGISQSFPFPGKRSLKKNISELNASAAKLHFYESRLQVDKDIKITWWQLFFLDRALEIIGRNKSLLKQFIDIARTKYEVGEGLQQDVLLAQLELSKLLDKEIQLKSLRIKQTIKLNQLLGRTSSESVVLPDKTNLDLPVVFNEETLLEKADKNRPLLLKQRHQLDASQEMLKLAKRALYPDFNLGAVYGDRQGENPMGEEWTDFVSLKLGLKIPLYSSSKQSKAIDQRKLELVSQEHALKETHLKIESSIHQALADYQQTKQQFHLFQDGIIPQAQQTVASMLAGYRVNKVDFLNLVRSQITLFNYETRYWSSLSTANQSLARLVAAVGEESIYE